MGFIVSSEEGGRAFQSMQSPFLLAAYIRNIKRKVLV